MDILTILANIKAEGGSIGDAKAAIMYAVRAEQIPAVQGMLTDEQIAKHLQ